MLLLTAHGVPLVLEFHPALTCERFCDLFLVLVGGNTVESATVIPWCSCGRSAKCERSAKYFLFANAISWGTGHCAGFSLGNTLQNARAICFVVLRQETHWSHCSLNEVFRTQQMSHLSTTYHRMITNAHPQLYTAISTRKTCRWVSAADSTRHVPWWFAIWRLHYDPTRLDLGRRRCSAARCVPAFPSAT
jgi:hypothetical protein